MIRQPHIDITLPASASIGASVNIQVSGPNSVDKLLCHIPLEEAFTRLGLIFNLCKCAHAVAFQSAIDCAKGVSQDPLQTDARRRLIEMEALQELSWKIMVDIPQQLGLQPKIKWFQQIKTQFEGPMQTLWQVAFYGAASETDTKPDSECPGTLVNRVVQSGWLSQLTMAIKEMDWQASEQDQNTVLMSYWSQLKNHFLALIKTPPLSPIGHVFAEPTRHSPGCAVSEVHGARGILSYGLCLDKPSEMVSSIRILPPTLQKFVHGQTIEHSLLSIPFSQQRMRQAKLLIALLNPCYPVNIALAEQACAALGGQPDA